MTSMKVNMRLPSTFLLAVVAIWFSLFSASVKSASEAGVVVNIEQRPCSEGLCCPDPTCINQKRLPDGRIRVEVGTYVATTQKIDPQDVDYSIDSDTLQLSYRKTTRHYEAGALIPACMMPVTLAFVVPGLPQGEYRVTVTEKIPYDILIVTFGFIALVFGVVAVIVLALRRRSVRQPLQDTAER